MAYELTKEFSFHAAHNLSALPKEHKCSHMHGHTYRVLITVRGDLDPDLGWVVDFGLMAKEARAIHALLDHKYLNEIPGLGMPTSENLARFIFERMQQSLQGLIRVTVFETATSYCVYSPFEQGVRVGVGPERFSAAHLVVSEAFTEPLHGHDFEVRLAFHCPQNHGVAARQWAAEILARVASDYNHKTLIPSKPAIGTLETGDKIVFSWKGRSIALKPEDVKLLDASHSTAEAIAGHIANEIKGLLNDTVPGIHDMELGLREEPGTLVTVKI